MRLLTAAAIAAFSLAALPAHALVIDDFNDGTSFNVVPGNPGPTNVASVSAIGGSRTMFVEATSSDGTTLASTGSTLDHGQTTQGPGSSSVTWDANGVGLGGIDLTDGGAATQVRISVLSIDVGNVDLALEVTDTGAQMSTLALTGLNVGTFGFDFASFAGTADLTAVDSIKLIIQAGADSDVQLDIVETNRQVSEPGMLALAGAGLIGGAIVTRRRRQ